MAVTRKHKQVEADLDAGRRRDFMRRLLVDLRALDRMLAEGWFESGSRRRIGAEQELFLVDKEWHAAPAALEVLRSVDDPHFTTELGLFNLEINVDPQLCRGDGLARMEAQLAELLEKTRRTCEGMGLAAVVTGILPTIRKSDLSIENMVPSPRYQVLSRAMSEVRHGAAYEFAIKGIDELNLKHDSVMVEACNASFQVHMQVGADELARLYNLAEVIAGPLMAVSANSPLLFGRRLWAETRIALFEQAVDTRSSNHDLRESLGRVTFGKRWVKDSVVEIYREDIARFRALVGSEGAEDPFEAMARGQAPELKALRLHNGTVYRWNRPCYGITDGKPHLRIENRIMPAGPTVLDQVANAAFWLGLMSEMAARHEDITREMEFDHARANFYAGARDGLDARFTWLGAEEIPAGRLILERLLPLAEEGLRREGVNDADIRRYLAVVEARTRTGRTGARWLLSSLAAMSKKAKGPVGAQLNALTAATVARQAAGRPVAEWERARLDEAGSSKRFLRAEQYMTTDFFTVRPDDPVELAANLMAWERIRHVPVEDEERRLLGLVSYRAVQRFLTGEPRDAAAVPVSEIMRTDVFTVTPHTPTLEAIAFMRRFRIGCLPVLQDGRLVGVVTEESFMDIAAELLEEKLKA